MVAAQAGYWQWRQRGANSFRIITSVREDVENSEPLDFAGGNSGVPFKNSITGRQFLEVLTLRLLRPLVLL